MLSQRSKGDLPGRFHGKYFPDSAMTDEISYALENWTIAGITTNPRHGKNSYKPLNQVIGEITG